MPSELLRKPTTQDKVLQKQCTSAIYHNIPDLTRAICVKVTEIQVLREKGPRQGFILGTGLVLVVRIFRSQIFDTRAFVAQQATERRRRFGSHSSGSNNWKTSKYFLSRYSCIVYIVPANIIQGGCKLAHNSFPKQSSTSKIYNLFGFKNLQTRSLRGKVANILFISKTQFNEDS